MTVNRSGAILAALALSLAMGACGPAAEPTPAPIRIGSPASIAAGGALVVSWSGVPSPGDYVTIVPAGATRTTTEPRVMVIVGTEEVTLTAPATAGDYEIWFVEGGTVDKVRSRLPLEVT